MPTCDIVIRTWKNDLHWLEYSLAFLKKNWLEPGRIIVIANSDCRERCQYWSGPGEFVYIDPWPDTHEFKCYCSLMSPELSEADLIMNVDSDSMLMTKSSLSDFLAGDVPIINFRNHTDLGDYLGIRLWSPLLQHWLGVPPIRSYMMQPPFLFWRSTIAAVRSLIETVSGQSVRDALYSEQPFEYHRFLEHPKKFPDWEVMGFYAELHEPSRYAWNDLTANPGQCRYKYYHSWTHWTPQIVAEMDHSLMAQ
jgi:hypothetical protein